MLEPGKRYSIFLYTDQSRIRCLVDGKPGVFHDAEDLHGLLPSREIAFGSAPVMPQHLMRQLGFAAKGNIQLSNLKYYYLNNAPTSSNDPQKK